MRFIDPQGNVVDGTPLSDEQFERREEIRKFVHAQICQGSYHSDWDRKHSTLKCEEVANFFSTKYTMTPLESTNMAAEIAATEDANSPLAVEMPSPSPAAEKSDGFPY